MDQNLVVGVVEDLFAVLFSGADILFAGVVILIASAFVGAPALASIALVGAEARWPLLQRSLLAAAVAAIVLTVVIGGVFIAVVATLAENYSENKTLYRLFPYLALGAVAVAGFVHYRARATFSRARGVGIAAAVLTPIVLSLFA